MDQRGAAVFRGSQKPERPARSPVLQIESRESARRLSGNHAVNTKTNARTARIILSMVNHLEPRQIPNAETILEELGVFLATAAFQIIDGTETCTDHHLGHKCLPISSVMGFPPHTVSKRATDLRAAC